MRFPKPWSKKRGGRLAARALSGAVGEAIFFAVLFLLGLFTLTLTVAGRLAAAASLPLDSGLGFWMPMVVAAALLGTGGAGLAYRILQVGASSERRSAMAKRAESLELIGPNRTERLPLPAVPRGVNLTDSPGTRLTYRLPSTGWAGWRAASAALLALLWNGVGVVLLGVVILGFQQQRPRWVLTGLLLPCAAVGVWSFRYFLTRLRETAGVGATIVEISDHPLQPGGTYRAYVAQFGRLRLQRLRIELICEEESTFRQGTDVRVEKYPARKEILLHEKHVRIDPGQPWEQEFPLTIPQDAMHSFRSPHNAVRWKVVVSGEARPWPSFCQSFPVVVHPLSGPPKRNPR